MQKYPVVAALVIAIIVTALSTQSCTNMTSRKGGDVLAGVYKNRLDEIQAMYGDPVQMKIAIANAEKDLYPDGTPADQNIAAGNIPGTARNAMLNDLIFLIDANYYFHEQRLYDDKAWTDFGGDAVSSILNLIGPALGVNVATKTMSWIAGGITSSKTAFNQDILQGQTLTIVINRMRALRATQLNHLRRGMVVRTKAANWDGGKDANGNQIINYDYSPRPVAQYSVQHALVDLVAYYNAGTFTSAIQDIQSQSAAEETAAKNNSNLDTPAAPAPSATPAKPPGS